MDDGHKDDGPTSSTIAYLALKWVSSKRSRPTSHVTTSHILSRHLQYTQ